MQGVIPCRVNYRNWVLGKKDKSLLYLRRKLRLTFGHPYQWPSVLAVGLCADRQGVLRRGLEDGNQEIIILVCHWELSSPKEHGRLSFFTVHILWDTFLFFLFNPLWDISLTDAWYEWLQHSDPVVVKRWILTLSTWKSSSCHSNPHMYSSHVQSLPLSSTLLSSC